MSPPAASPSELARETLKTLATRKIPPTPDNYARIFSEISGLPPSMGAENGSGAEKVLLDIAERLTQTPKSAPSGMTLKKVVGAGDWEQCFKELEKILPKLGEAAVQSWSNLIRDLLRQLETTHKGLTVTRKKAGVETVLSRFASNPEVLFEKLTGLMRSWSESPTAASTDETDPPTPDDTSASKPVQISSAPDATVVAEMLADLSELLAQTLESVLSTQPDLAQDVKALAAQVRGIKTRDQLTTITKLLRQFWIKAELHGSDITKVHEGLVRLLRLLVENVGEMVEGEEWLHGQIVILQEIIAQPIDKQAIADAERSLRDAVIKQGLLKQNLNEAKLTLKNLMSSFIDKLGEITESTGEYHQKIEGYSQKISQSDNITELSHLLDDIMQDTRIIQASAQHSHEELLASQVQVQAAESKIKQLEQELAQVSDLVREDQLTGVLNRRGLDEAFERELSKTSRNNLPLCVALLDIDNFKRLNDTLGHQTGDQALKHLSSVIQETLRPSDTVARYGGEEFIILLPDIELDAAHQAIERLQRELTKKLFLHDNERVLVTFSAGVALRAAEESQQDVIARADKAMYQAKNSGKNRVVAAA